MNIEEARHHLSKVRYRNWRFTLEESDHDDHFGYYVSLRIATSPVMDAYGSGQEIGLQSSSTIPIYSMHTGRHIAEWVRRAIRDMEQHEADEWFKFDGKRIFNPHKGEARRVGS